MVESNSQRVVLERRSQMDKAGFTDYAMRNFSSVLDPTVQTTVPEGRNTVVYPKS
jgi:alcohol dehydrogenase YqhD (iron-dependent ADH family)